MTTNNEAFDKWAKDHEYAIDDYVYALEIWNAATAEANKRIAELEGEVAELKAQGQVDEFELQALKQDRNDLNYLCMERLHKIESLEAHINTLRKVMEEIINCPTWAIGTLRVDKVKQALTAAPAQSLQEHDNEMIEKCANVVADDSMAITYQSTRGYRNALIQSLRALKQEVK